MRFGIQHKVGGLLTIVLIISFGFSGCLATWQIVKTLADSGHHNMTVLREMGDERAKNAFSSFETAAKGSLERGEMEVFHEMLLELGQMSGVEEIGLTNPEGLIVYSSQPNALHTHMDGGIFAKAIAAQSGLVSQEIDNAKVMARIHLLGPDCVRCHINRSVGDVSGALYVKYSIAEQKKAELLLVAELAEARRTSIIWGITTGVGGLFISLIAIYIMIGKMVRQPLEKVNAMMIEMAKGHPVNHLSLNSHDEIGQMTKIMDGFADSLQNEVAGSLQKLANGDLTFNVQPADDEDIIRGSLQKVGKNLNALLQNIKISGDNIASKSEVVSHSSQILSNGATAQAKSLEEIASSIEQMSQQTEKNTTFASQAEDFVKGATTSAVKGNSHMEHLIEAMSEISESGKNISKIIRVIDEIAFQTNLLALNAAVEAARAGRHGKGFAVVAEEVRNLAGRSAQAARETTALIEGSVAKAKNGSEIAGQTAEALAEIMTAVQDVSGLIAEISSSSKDQNKSIQVVNQGLQKIETVTMQNTDSATDTATAANELFAQADSLKELLRHFNIRMDEPTG